MKEKIAQCATDPKLLSQAEIIYKRVKDKRRQQAVRDCRISGKPAVLKEPSYSDKPIVNHATCNINYQYICRLSSLWFSLEGFYSYTMRHIDNKLKINFYKNNYGERAISDSSRIKNSFPIIQYIHKFNIDLKIGRYSMEVFDDYVLIDLESYSAR